ncbi:iron transport multicopper oxidase FET3 precursor [Nadsonia fulvescens var. elongata DSM 6958]|uniref:Iron transport multicopper oxidase FET3 n=1 Tax=Nadsonia fulvescens var. elongata DSM 6958 TaxID=857566 RepID=A0A1E3PMF6_9ASCO|nr:iron transport multicopper oxidase FET3 precursor [Nadsonia fulvescens var. elongata DSM 6958]
MKSFVVLLLAFMAMVSAKTVTYNLTATWVQANPDGCHERRVIGVNNVWPPPTIEVDKGDTLVVHFTNGLDDRNSTIHWHGLYQNGTADMDGPSMVSQCPVAPGASVVYNFTVNQNGTYWYHAHVPSQYPDGFRGAFIVHDKEAYFADMYDEELVLPLSEWYHDEMQVLVPKFMSLYNPSGAEPIPQNLLFNETMNSTIHVKPNTTYLIRLINIGAFVSQYFWIEDHDFQIVEVDGVYTEPSTADLIYITAAQRYSILLTTKNTTDKNYAIGTRMDDNMLDLIPEDLLLNQTNWLGYNDDKSDYHNADPSLKDLTAPFDDFYLVPHDKQGILPEPDHEIVVDVSMDNLDDGVNYAFFNNITYTRPKVPTLYTVLSAGDDATNSLVYGEFTHTVVLEHMDVIQIVVNNADTGTHPFHLHGHEFQVINRSPSYGDDDPTPYDPESSDNPPFPDIPMRRDTVYLRPSGHMVLRFRADNPGVWLFHCHIEWHLEQGLVLTFVEAPKIIQEQTNVRPDHWAACADLSVPTTGNAAANSANFLDLTGQNAQVIFLPAGFTARGIVALVFSCISAFIGMGFIAWYGASDLSNTEAKIILKNGVELNDDQELDIQDTETVNPHLAHHN